MLASRKSSTAQLGSYPRSKRAKPDPLGGNFVLVASLLEYVGPALMLPEQYYPVQKIDDGLTAEKGLMLAVLTDGIRCFYRYVRSTRRKHRRISAEAENWLLEDSLNHPFSFRVICETLRIDADALRSRLMAWKAAELERRRVTGATQSIQVGRSAFPALVAD